MEKSKYSFQNKIGFTLVEAIIVISIIGILSLIASSIFDYGLMASEKGSNLGDEQGGVRTVSDVITQDLRFAYEVRVIDNKSSANIDRTLYSSSNSLYRFDGVEDIEVVADIVQSITFTLEVVAGEPYLDYTIIGVNGFEVSSRILLINVDPNYIVESSGNMITYDYVGNGRR